MSMINNGSTSLEVLHTGDYTKLISSGIMINQIEGSPISPNVSNIYLRLKGEEIKYYPLIGCFADEHFVEGNQVVYKGTREEVKYEIYFTILDGMWFFDVFLENTGEKRKIDVVYSQDVGLASEGHVKSNEAYNAHYIDHKVFENENGFTVCSRQNQGQPGGFPFLQQGSFNKTVAYSVDGYPFFGLGYKFDEVIEDLTKPMLNSRLLQYEFAFTALQTEEVELTGSQQFTFYGAFKSNLATKITEPLSFNEIKKAHDSLIFKASGVGIGGLVEIFTSKTVSSLPLTNEEIDKIYVSRLHEEKHDDKLLSFFKETGEHVVLMEKERYVARPHGNVLISFSDEPFEVLTTTNYIYGVFNSHIALGNTTFNKFDTNCRNGLNASKASGQRIMIKVDGEYKLLAMPAVYEMGFNYTKWLYKFEDDIIEITNLVDTDGSVIKMNVVSQNDKQYDFIVYHVISNDVKAKMDSDVCEINFNEGTLAANNCPGLKFSIENNKNVKVVNESKFYPKKGSICDNILVMEFLQEKDFEINVYGTMNGEFIKKEINTDEEIKNYREKLHAGINHFNLTIENNKKVCEANFLQPVVNTETKGFGRKMRSSFLAHEEKKQVEKFNALALWYSHNARVHYSSPHGLEQYGGAAWGTRDVCQGPFEYFLMSHKYSVCKFILERVYRNQYLENGNWPQWFMFDEYRTIQHHESHGDIIVWPIKAVAAYLEATHDFEFLNTKIPYTHINGYALTEEKETLLDHIKRQINAIKDDFIKDTKLSCYGGGDWDDTLQPARRELAQNMVSGWTVALTYQVFNSLAKSIDGFNNEFANEIKALAEGIREDYKKYLLKDGVAAGFLLFAEEGLKYMLHPEDNETGIKYRLLPMIRGIISEMFTKEEAEKHFGLIKEHLYHPDGVRLMDTTVKYLGGENKNFMRAETSASFSREVSLHYVHAHIRFIEAMAKFGNAEEAWLGLKKINPINLFETVQNAAIRQNNVYFTSSDAAFENRYDAMDNFDKLKTGEIKVKSGWRLYSSGPGIYLNQLVSNVLGLRIKGSKVVLDPILPIELNGLKFNYSILGKPVEINYIIEIGTAISKVVVNGVEVKFKRISEPYRTGGVAFPIEVIKNDSVIQVYM